MLSVKDYYESMKHAKEAVTQRMKISLCYKLLLIFIRSSEPPHFSLMGKKSYLNTDVSGLSQLCFLNSTGPRWKKPGWFTYKTDVTSYCHSKNIFHQVKRATFQARKQFFLTLPDVQPSTLSSCNSPRPEDDDDDAGRGRWAEHTVTNCTSRGVVLL